MLRSFRQIINTLTGVSIDNSPIGQSTPASGRFSDLGIGTTSLDGRTVRGLKTGSDFDLKYETNTSGVVSLGYDGYSNNTNLATTVGGAVISLRNKDTTDGNFTALKGLDSGGATLNMIAFVNASHANNEGYTAFFSRPASGNLTEAGRFDSSGHLLVGTTDNTPYNNSTSAGTGTSIGPNGQIWNHAHDGDLGTWNRTGSDGSMFLLNRDGSTVATVSVASGVVTWGTFCGGHNSQFIDNSQPEIERGTVISSIDSMCEWKTVRWVETVVESVVAGTRNVEDENGETHQEPIIEERQVEVGKQSDYYGPEIVGAVFTDENGNEKTVHAKQNDQLPRCKVSSVLGDGLVYGTFSHYDEHGTPIIHSLGQTVARVTGPISAGDLLMSKGDGTACKWVESYGYSAVLGKCRQGAPDAAETDINLLAYTSMAG